MLVVLIFDLWELWLSVRMARVCGKRGGHNSHQFAAVATDEDYRECIKPSGPQQSRFGAVVNGEFGSDSGLGRC